jgi:hypothetical protein
VRLTSRLATILATLGLAFLLGASTASAVVVRSQIEAFGPDGTSASSFDGLKDLALDQNTRGLYAVEQGAPGVFGFDVSALPTHHPLAGFSPLVTAASGSDPGVAVDNTALPSAGNVYFVSESTGLIYGFNSSGAPLGGNFPIDPTISPGAPLASPKDLCGAGVDSAGNLWVPNFSTSNIFEYSSAGVYQRSVSVAAQNLRPCSVDFDSNDDMYATDGNGSVEPTYKYTASSGYTAATLINSNSGRGVAVDRSTHHVFTIDRATAVGEYDSAGNLISATSVKDSSGAIVIPTSSGLAGASIRGVAVDSASNRLYAADESLGKIRVFGDALVYPDLILGTASGIEDTSASVDGTVSAQGVAISDCHFEYVKVLSTRDFSDLSSGGSAPCNPFAGSIPADSATHPVSATLSGLTANTAYRFRLVAGNANGSIATAEGNFETHGPPLVETTGSPVRTVTGARLDARLDPRGPGATYHFEYGDQGPCDSNPCTSTAPQAAGSSDEFELVSQQIDGLQPSTTYHYRVIADNGDPSGPAAGKDMTVTTFADDLQLSHGHLPGPVGSDRAWELASAPDTGGNPVGGILVPLAASISDNGDRAVYGVSGGTPDSETGTNATLLLAERTPSGWQTKKIYPHRDEATGNQWRTPGGPSDLSAMVAENNQGSAIGEFSVWRMTPTGPPQKLYSNANLEDSVRGGFSIASDDASRVLTALRGTQDPEHPVSSGPNLYDISSGSPRLIDLLPNGAVPSCGVETGSGGLTSDHFMRWVSADGSLAFFPSNGDCFGRLRLYLRDFATETTKLISTPPVSGPECDSYFIKSTPEAAFFYTQSRLVEEDSAQNSCVSTGSASSGDIYRYDLSSGALDCVTCVVPGVDAGVSFSTNPKSIGEQIGISEDGSRAYFTSGLRLLPGAPTTGGIYRLDVASGDLAYVGNFGYIGDIGRSAMNAGGSVVVFGSDKPSLNSLGGQQNGETIQYYRYDDHDRSLICISCPAGGSLPRGAVSTGADNLQEVSLGSNRGPLSADGGDFAFATPTPLVAADQNTAGAGQDPAAGTDVYEWREGKLLLVSDGLSNWPVGQTPRVAGITPSGHDIFFAAAAQYTQDALDGYSRLYDARIGGGFEFPRPPKPCPLEVCQGTPKGAPEEAAPGTATVAGVGNVSSAGRVSCAKPKRKVRKGGKTRCVKPARNRHVHKRTNHSRRAAR